MADRKTIETASHNAASAGIELGLAISGGGKDHVDTAINLLKEALKSLLDETNDQNSL